MEQTKIQDKDVALLKVLSVPLQKHLAQATYQPVLTEHIYFHYYAYLDASAFGKLCHSALTLVSLSKGDVLFSASEVASRMFFVKKGTLRYFCPVLAQHENTFAPKESS